MRGTLSDLALQKHDLCPCRPQHSLRSDLQRRHTSLKREECVTVFDKQSMSFVSGLSPLRRRTIEGRAAQTDHTADNTPQNIL